MKNNAPLSPSLKLGQTLYISGQVGINPATDKLADESFEIEVRQMMENLKTQLSIHHADCSNLVSVIVYLKSMQEYKAFNAIYSTYFSERFPTRTCIAVLDLPLGASVEISGIAQVS